MERATYSTRVEGDPRPRPAGSVRSGGSPKSGTAPLPASGRETPVVVRKFRAGRPPRLFAAARGVPCYIRRTLVDRLTVLRQRVGAVLQGKLRLERLIGVGGAAAVYEATHRTGRRFAVKVLHERLSADPVARERFQREARAANSIDHPAIVPVYDDDVDEELGAYLVMELLDGDPLNVVLEAGGGQLSVSEVVRFADTVLEVLELAHQEGVIHRDIKPENLFLTRRGDLKVLDFGIARAVEQTWATDAKTAQGELMGTPAYMAPEQARGQWDQVDHRIDLFAVGATVFTLVSGQDVHLGSTPREVMALAMTTPARSLASVAASLPLWLTEWVDRALAFNHDDRWLDAATMRQALRENVVEALDPLDACDINSGAPTVATGDSERVLRNTPVGVARTLAGERRPSVGKTLARRLVLITAGAAGAAGLMLLSGAFPAQRGHELDGSATEAAARTHAASQGVPLTESSLERESPQEIPENSASPATTRELELKKADEDVLGKDPAEPSSRPGPADSQRDPKKPSATLKPRPAKAVSQNAKKPKVRPPTARPKRRPVTKPSPKDPEDWFERRL